jgi:hypothetical protein
MVENPEKEKTVFTSIEQVRRHYFPEATRKKREKEEMEKFIREIEAERRRK